MDAVGAWVAGKSRALGAEPGGADPWLVTRTPLCRSAQGHVRCGHLHVSQTPTLPVERGSPATLLSSSRTLPGFRGNETTAGLEKEPRQAGPVVPRTLGSSAPFSEPGSGARVALPFSLRPGPGPTQAPLNASTNTGQCVCPAQFACDTLAPSLSAALQGGGPTLGQRRGSSTSERTEEELSGPDAGTRGCLPR